MRAPLVEPEPPGVRADAPRWSLLLPVLLALTVLTRLPSLTRTLWNPDEGFLATQARMLADGGTLYDTVVDRKPPLVPWLYQAAFAVFGDESLWPLKAAAVAAVAATGALLASLAARRRGGRAGWTAGVLAVLLAASLAPADAQAASFGVFLLPCTAAAVWCADRRHWVLAGTAVAAAFLVKQTGGAVLLPVLFLAWRNGGVRPAGRVLAGFAAPVAAVALSLDPERFLFWTVTGSGAYASVEGAGLLALGRAAGGTAILATACAPLLWGLVRDRTRPRDCPDVWVWLGASAAAVCVGFQFFGHYFLQLTPPLALLGACALHPVRVRPALAATAAVTACFVTWGLLAPQPELDHARRVASAVRAHTAPTDRVLLWGMHPEGYWLADRRPASRYLTAGFLTNFSGGRGGVRVGERYAVPGTWTVLRRELATAAPKLIVDDSRGKPYRPARTPTLRRVLAERYERLGTVDGAVLYVRR